MAYKLGDIVSCAYCTDLKNKVEPCIARVMSVVPLTLHVVYDLQTAEEFCAIESANELNPCKRSHHSRLTVLEPKNYLQYLL